LGSFAMAELGAMIPRSGGYYVLTRRAYGEYLSFAVGWTDWLGLCASGALVAILAGQYAQHLLPRLARLEVVVAIVAVMILTLVQWRGVRWGGWAQNITSGITAVAFFCLIVGGLMLTGRTGSTTIPSPLPSGLALATAVFLVVQSVVYTYDGWYGVIYFGDEIENPGREIPRAMVLSVLLLSVIYVLTNVALLHAVSVKELARQTLSVAPLGVALVGQYGDTLVYLLMIVSLLALANATLLQCSRVLHVMSEYGAGLRQLTHVNSGGTPSVGLWITTATLFAMIVSGSFDFVLALGAFFFVAKYTLAYLALFLLRKKEPETPRPYRAWGYPWTVGVVLVLSLMFLGAAFAADTRHSLYGLTILLASCPMFWLVKRVSAAGARKEC
jgi:basic amino acid/polyamine antiporter, APA family